MSKIKIIEIKCNTKILKHEEGSRVQVKSVNGVPTDSFWRRRLADAEIDGCCEVFSDAPVKEEKKSEKK